jgi:3-oxoacyl-[acyl-carrier protein] reductase
MLARPSRMGGPKVLLENRSALVYGGGGPIGGAVARAFAREGARVFLASRSRSKLEAVAQEIARTGGRAEVDEVDALDEDAVDRHADSIADRAGGIDVSFNAIAHGDVHGPPLVDMPLDDFSRPVGTAVRSFFLTTRAAARHMATRGSGVVMAVTATTARLVIPMVGGTGVAFDALESLCRQFARELGPSGVRVVWLYTTGIPEALYGGDQPDYGTGGTMTADEHVAWMESQTMLGRLTSLADVGHAAVFLASDHARAMTATGINLTCGAVPG